MLARRCANAGEFRTRRLKYAVTTSLGSKVGTTCLQLIAMPLAIRALGTEQFALYATLAAMMGWSAAINLGVGPAVVTRMAAAVARDDRAASQRVFTSAALPMLLMAAAAGTLVFALLSLLPVSLLLGGNFPHYHAVARFSLLLLASAALTQALLTLPEAAQAGYQEQYVFNLWSMAGSILSTAVVIGVSCCSPSVPGIVAAVALVPLTTRAINAGRFLRRRSYLLPRWRAFSWGECRAVLESGAAFWLVGGCSAFLLHQMPVALAGRTLPPREAASLAAVMNVLLIGFGMVSMVTLPLWPAVADSLSLGDTVWIARARRRVLTFAMVYALGVCVGLGFYGQPILRLWLGPSIQPSEPLLIGMGIYFVLLTWEHIHYMLMAGMQTLWPPSLLMTGRAILTILVMPTMIRRFGEAGPALALAGFTILLTAWSFPLLYRRGLKYAITASPPGELPNRSGINITTSCLPC